MESKERLKERYVEALTLFWEKFKIPRLDKVKRIEQFAKGMNPYHEGIVRILKLATDFRFRVEVVYHNLPLSHVRMPFGLASLFLTDGTANGISCYVPVQSG